jgi:hypothetical protein
MQLASISGDAIEDFPARVRPPGLIPDNRLVLGPKPNRWHPCMLPDDYPRKLKRDLAESDAAADSTTHREPVVEEGSESRSDESPPP